MSWRDHTKDKVRVIRIDLMEAQGGVPQCISRTVYELGRIPGARRRRLRHIDNKKEVEFTSISSSMYFLNRASFGHTPIAVPKILRAAGKSSRRTSNLANKAQSLANVNRL